MRNFLDSSKIGPMKIGTGDIFVKRTKHKIDEKADN